MLLILIFIMLALFAALSVVSFITELRDDLKQAGVHDG